MDKIELINIAVDFIEKNNLGMTDFLNLEEKQYTDIEKNRLDYLLEICDNLLNGKISFENLQSIVKNKLQISDDLSRDIYEQLRFSLTNKETDKEDINIEKKESAISTENVNKKSIFSTMVK